jgi:IS4 transposase
MRLRPPPPKPDPVEALLALVDDPAVPQFLIAPCQAMPLGVMVRVLLDHLVDDAFLEPLRQQHAPQHYTRALTLTALVRLMLQIAAGNRASLFAAYQADQACAQPTIATSHQALYQKLGRVPPALTEALVRLSCARLRPLVAVMPAAEPPLLPGYRARILDGNVLTKTEHRLKPLRAKANGCLPGKALVVYEPEVGLVTDLIMAEDAYAQERVLARDLVPRVEPGEVWIADRHFATAPFTFGVQRRGGFFLVRQHQSNLPVAALTEPGAAGQTETGTVYEQRVRTVDGATGETMDLRRIEIRLFAATRDGDRVLGLLTNLPAAVSALTIATLYLKRWRIETLFQFLTESLHCEVPSLGQPRAALFAFAMALVAANALAVVRASLRAAHGVEAAAEVSGYYLADEIGTDYRVLLKFVPPERWPDGRATPPAELARLLTTVAGLVNVRALQRHRRGPKKPRPQRSHDKRHSHYSTYRLLKEDEDSC